MDQPKIALEMISMFVSDKSLSGGNTKIAESRVEPAECATAAGASSSSPASSSRSLPSPGVSFHFILQAWVFYRAVTATATGQRQPHIFVVAAVVLAAVFVAIMAYRKTAERSERSKKSVTL